MGIQHPSTLGDIARRLGIPAWQVRRVFERGLLPEPARLGRWRVVYPDQIPALEAALTEAGYLPAEEAAGV
jgi:hypothetical protein